jgi:general secretion pathway protein M
MSLASKIAGVRARAREVWNARTEQERKFLTAGGAVLLLALLYALLVAPAADGRAQLKRALPQLRQQAAQLQALGAEASALAREPVAPVTPMTRQTLAASLTARGLTPQTLEMTGEYAKLRLAGVSFANLVAWLDAERRENRVMVQDAAVSAQTPAGQVDATLTLRQSRGEAAAGAAPSGARASAAP